MSNELRIRARRIAVSAVQWHPGVDDDRVTIRGMPFGACNSKGEMTDCDSVHDRPLWYGDWLVTYDDGTYEAVTDRSFDALYEVIEDATEVTG